MRRAVTALTSGDKHEYQLGTLVRCLIVVLYLLVGISAFAEDLAPSFEQAAQLADAQQYASSTKSYFSNTLMPYYVRKYQSVLQSCFASISKPDSSPFGFVAAIGTDGRLLRLYNNRETNIFWCIRATLQKDLFPPPPISPFYLHIDMVFTNEDECYITRWSQRKGSTTRTAAQQILLYFWRS